MAGRSAKAFVTLFAGVLMLCAVITVVVTIAQVLRGDATLSTAVSGIIAAGVVLLLARFVPAPRLLAGYSALVYVVLFAPIIIVVIYAFNGGESVTVFDHFSLRWFSRALADESITTAVARSARIAVLAALLSVIVGTAAAIFLARARNSIRLPIESMALLAVVVPELVIAIALLLFFVRLGFPLGDATMVIGHSLFGVALVMIVVRSRFTTMGTTLERASADLGAGPWATLWQVTLPPAMPAIGAAGLLAFTFSFDDVVISQFASGAGNQTWPLRILSALRFGLSPDINATATMMLGITVVGLVGAGLLVRRTLASQD